MKCLVSALIMPILLFSIACSHGATSTSDPSRAEMDNSYAALAMSEGVLKTRTNASLTPDEETRIQLNASLSLRVKNLDVAVTQVQNLVTHYRGRVTNSNAERSGLPYINIAILVPRSSFDGLLTDIKQIESSVTNENIHSTDVTEEFIDIDARLKVMKKTEDRFIALMADTRNVEEIIQVEKEHLRIRGDIDSLEGRMDYLSKTTQNSVNNLHMTQEAAITGNSWNPKDSLDNSIRFFISFLKKIADIFIWAFVFSPIILILAVIYFLIYRWVKKARSSKNAT